MIRTANNLFGKVQNLIDNGVKSVSIIQSPDYCGGHKQSLCFSSNEDEDWWADLPDFTYVEWNGRPIDLLIQDPWLNNHYEPFHEEPGDLDWPWYEEI